MDGKLPTQQLITDKGIGSVSEENNGNRKYKSQQATWPTSITKPIQAQVRTNRHQLRGYLIHYNQLKDFPENECASIAMSKFTELDSKLENLSNKLSAQLSRDRPDHPNLLRTFEERRIDWQRDDIRRAIIIQPTFEATGVNSASWNFINIAWKDEGCSKRKYIKWLVEEKEFTEIADNIDRLLEESEKTLTRISDQDLN